jgi:dolichol-phosphate mannosyltransferase
MPEIIAMLPTYNEASNIKQVIEDILNCGSNIAVLVVDDMSPDGTYKIVQDLAKNNANIHLLLRKENKGRGYAGIEGFKKALEMGAKYIVEMDADGSHNPLYIPFFKKEINDCDVVIGSRYIKGGKDEHRDIIRRTLSAASRTYLSFIIGTSVKDPTSGFRMFKRTALESFVDKLKASDPFIVTEVLYHLQKNKYSIKEYPIEFLQRISGKSKLQPFTLVKYLFKAILLKFGN